MSDIPNLVLVEGSDDIHFLLHLLYLHGFRADREDNRYIVRRIATQQRVELKPKGGFESLVSQLPTELFPTFLERVALVVDADTSSGNRCASIAARLNIDFGLTAGGCVVSSERLAVGVWIMLDNSRNGYVEQFLADLIGDADKLWPHAQGVVAAIPERRFPEPRIQKAEIHTWLAWQEQPGTRAAQAITRKYLDVNRPPAVDFVNWFNRWLDTPAPSE